MATFRDRHDAGIQLAAALRAYAGVPDVVVFALPRGGVPVGYEVARRLGAPLDVVVVRKLGVPGREELAMGAIASGGVEFVNELVTGGLGISRSDLAVVAARERTELARRERVFRGDRPAADVRGKTAILVDDGLATGATMSAAIEAIRARGAARIVCAVPVGPPHACDEIAERVDELVCLDRPAWLDAISQAYDDFTQTTDDEVRELVARGVNRRNATRYSAISSGD